MHINTCMGFLLFLLACNDHCLTKDHLDYFIGEWWQGYHSGETVTGCYLFEEAGIIIEDNGPGIPDKNYEDVFKPFFSLDPSRNKLKGESGLGLSITRDIIRAHGGEIKLSKSSYGGLKSLIQLPI